jgi:hypothetical protein
MAERNDDPTLCRSCQDAYPTSDLDRYLWCPSCRRGLARRAAIWGRAVGFLCAVIVGLYVATAISPGRRYLVLYAVVLILTYYLTGRIGRALAQGFYRARNRAPGVIRSTRQGEGSAD